MMIILLLLKKNINKNGYNFTIKYDLLNLMAEKVIMI